MSIGLLVHDEMLSEAHLNLCAEGTKSPFSTLFFVFDPLWLAQEGWRLKRIQFVADALAEMPQIEIYNAPIAEIVQQKALTGLVTIDSPNPHIRAMIARAGVPCSFTSEPAFANCDGKVTRFMHYWKKVESQFFPRKQ